MNKMTPFYLFIALVTPALAAEVIPGKLPARWYELPEERTSGALAENKRDADPEKSIAPALNRILAANARALEQSDRPSTETTSEPNRPKDWTPWHLEYFSTDLGVSASGLLGVMTIKGSPSVSAFWRKQGKAPAHDLPSSFSGANNGSDLAFSELTTAQDLNRQVDHLVRLAMARGNVTNERELRKNLRSIVGQLQAFASGIDTRSESVWWVSGFRFDLQIEASGKVSWASTVGGDLRFKLEWKRMKRKNAPILPTRAGNLTALPPIVQDLVDFVTAMREDMEAVSAEKPAGKGFEAHSFRIGIGVTAQGNIGVVKGGASAMGHLNFSRDVKKPVVRRLQPLASHRNHLWVIERQVDAHHLSFAQANGISFIQARHLGESDEVAFSVERARFREGLKIAFEIGEFFTEQGAKAHSDGWHVYEMKMGFDVSIVGALGLAKLGALASTEFAFVNQNF